ncbi:hypothetical protein LXA43DRAFT_1050178 [Ganoderma leucocontextum]|nr:hypothetical protein LXA43DRAFT_1050178 [Ganoderma leucocontextum]
MTSCYTFQFQLQHSQLLPANSRESSPSHETEHRTTPSTVSSVHKPSHSPLPSNHQRPHGPHPEHGADDDHAQPSPATSSFDDLEKSSTQAVPANAQPPYSYFAYVPDDVIHRIETKIRTINAPDRGHLAIAQVPAAATWGFGYTDRYLTYDRKNIVVCAVSRWRSGRFKDNEGNFVRRVNAGIYLPHQADRDALKALRSRAIPPPDSDANFLWAKRYMTVREQGKEIITAFSDAFDARHSSNLASATAIPPWTISQNGVVLLRFRVCRWRPGGIAQPWKDGFKVLFELLQIYLLYEAPPHVLNELDNLVVDEAADVDFDI